MIVRDSRDADLAAIHKIYAHHVEHGFGSFEEAPPTPAALAERRAAVLDKGLPYLAAEADGQVLGYAYAGPFRPRSAYRFSLEDSIYVAPAATGQGVGRKLLAELLARAEAWGARQMVAVIGDTQNKGSIGLHTAFGFRMVGIFEGIGYKRGRWVDSVMMQLALGSGAHGAPQERT